MRARIVSQSSNLPEAVDHLGIDERAVYLFEGGHPLARTKTTGRQPKVVYEIDARAIGPGLNCESSATTPSRPSMSPSRAPPVKHSRRGSARNRLEGPGVGWTGDQLVRHVGDTAPGRVDHHDPRFEALAAVHLSRRIGRCQHERDQLVGLAGNSPDLPNGRAHPSNNLVRTSRA